MFEKDNKPLGQTPSLREVEVEDLEVTISNEMDDIFARLRYLGYTIKAIFGIARTVGVSCTGIFAETSQGYEVIINVEYVRCKNVMIMDQVRRDLCNPATKNPFLEIAKKCPTNICFINERGIDLSHNSTHNYLFTSDEDVLKFSNHDDPHKPFLKVVPCVGFSELQSDLENNTIGTFVCQHADISMFYNIMKQIEATNVLFTPGEFLICAPSNRILDQPGFLEKHETIEKMKMFVFRHILRVDDETGKATNMLGIEVDISTLPVLFQKLEKVNGSVMVINAFIPESQGEVLEVFDELQEVRFSDADLALTTLFLWKTCNALAKKVLPVIRKRATDILSSADKYEKSISDFAKVGDSMLRADGVYRDILYVKPHKKEEKPKIGDVNQSEATLLQKATTDVKEVVKTYVTYVGDGMTFFALATN